MLTTIFMYIQTNAADRYHLRLHRARSVILTDEELVEVRAAQRTFEGAYVRTALSQFSFALVSACFLFGVWFRSCFLRERRGEGRGVVVCFWGVDF